MVAMASPRAPGAAVQRLIVEMYEAGASTAEIKAASGTTSIYPVLKRAGIGTNRQRRYRNPQVRDEVQEEIHSALKAAVEAAGTAPFLGQGDLPALATRPARSGAFDWNYF